MSIHPSLSSSSKHKKQRSVLKRTERINMMIEKGSWKEGDSVFGLPKIKLLKLKFKKEKTAKAETVEGAPATATGAAAAGAAPAAAKAPADKTAKAARPGASAK